MTLITININKHGKKKLNNIIYPSGLNKLDITLKACQRISFLYKNENKNGYFFKIYIKRNGCSGYKFLFKLVKMIDKGWHIFYKDCIKYCVPFNFFSLFGNSILDVNENQSFIILSPNIVNECSCGKSFDIKNNN